MGPRIWRRHGRDSHFHPKTRPERRAKGRRLSAHKWGGTGALPASHPFKEVAPVFDNSPKLTPVIGQVGYGVVTRNGLLGEWLFDDNDTTNTIVDTSGNNYNGTNSNGVFSTDTPRGIGTSLILVGETITHGSLLEAVKPFSASIRPEMHSPSHYGPSVSRSMTGGV